jgi:hypothetical protein
MGLTQAVPNKDIRITMNMEQRRTENKNFIREGEKSFTRTITVIGLSKPTQGFARRNAKLHVKATKQIIYKCT